MNLGLKEVGFEEAVCPIDSYTYFQMPPRRIPTKPATPKEGTVKEISKEGAELEKLENKVGHQVGRC